MSESRTAPDRELLAGLCTKHGVKIEVVEELLKVEKEYQFRDRRHGIYDRLREAVQASISPEERKD
jgi:hypothetical protein